MVGQPAAAGSAGHRRVLVVLETGWDRKQLAACRDRWGDRVELSYPPPDDVSCPFEWDALGFIDAVCRGEHGRVDGVVSSSDYPGATVAAAIATRLGLPGPRPERVIGASHKYYSRMTQRDAAPEAVPRFALVDPSRPELPPAEPSFPCFVKPVKGAFSVLARKVADREALRALLASDAVKEFTGDYMRIFNQLVAGLTDYACDGHWFLAEELLSGRLVTLEGFVAAGRVEVLGIVDSGLDPSTGSFVRFDYPSSLPAVVQERMADVSRRVIRALALDWTLFNIELTWDETTDKIAIVEVNPRICGQFADLYQKVDGTSGYEILLSLALGEHPRIQRGSGRFAAAASFPLRVFRPCRVASAPSDAALATAEAGESGTLVWNECAAGDVLADFDADEDGASHRYAVLNLGGESRDDLDRRRRRLEQRLGWHMSDDARGRGSGRAS